jgi:hypothetical protein
MDREEEKDDEEEDKPEEEEEEEELDRDMGDTGEEAQAVDEKLWNDKEDEKTEEEKFEENAPMKGKVSFVCVCFWFFRYSILYRGYLCVAMLFTMKIREYQDWLVVLLVAESS